MPVEDVILVHLHQVEVVPDDGLGDVVPAGVHQDAAVGEPRSVHDLGSVDDILNQGKGLEYNRTIIKGTRASNEGSQRRDGPYYYSLLHIHI